MAKEESGIEAIEAGATPEGMLKVYRQQSSHWTGEQVKRFLKMPFADKLELVFYMLLHTNASLQHLHEQIDPNAVVVPMPKLDKPN
jgi:hypothetical protein